LRKRKVLLVFAKKVSWHAKQELVYTQKAALSIQVIGSGEF